MDPEGLKTLVRDLGNLIGGALVLFALTTVTSDSTQTIAYASVGIGCMLLPMAMYGLPGQKAASEARKKR
ncbi:MAG: hypothetical protein NT157_04520 [Candidatus Micrarchaeota archaeon]|nr:hypothetical protein [Candidatus Micrarchaeota archaeon]